MNAFAAFSLGLLSSAHCIGMCGGFAAMVGLSRRSTSDLVVRQLLYSSGRIATYSFLGALGGFAGAHFSALRTGFLPIQQVFSIVAGVVLIVVAAAVLGWIPRRIQSLPGVGSLLAPMFCHFFQAGNRWEVFLGGLANGFLPCGLVYAFLAQAVATGSLAGGISTMAAFGTGTVPVMVAVGGGASLASLSLRRRIFQIAACVMLVAGGATIYRAIPTDQGQICCSHDAVVAVSP